MGRKKNISQCTGQTIKLHLLAFHSLTLKKIFILMMLQVLQSISEGRKLNLRPQKSVTFHINITGKAISCRYFAMLMNICENSMSKKTMLFVSNTTTH